MPKEVERKYEVTLKFIVSTVTDDGEPAPPEKSAELRSMLRGILYSDLDAYMNDSPKAGRAFDLAISGIRRMKKLEK